MAYAISTQNLTKRYGKKIAVNDVSLNIPEGEIYGLIGRNGAGKTTIMKMLLGMTNPTSGDMKMLHSENISLARQQIGSIIEVPKFHNKQSAYINLKTRAMLIGIPKNEIDNSIDEALKYVDLLDKKNDKVASFSLGMTQRLGIAAAIIGKPRMLILDEPINGLDPVAITKVRHILQKLNKEKGVTIFISSHILDEMQKIATNYGFIVKGKLVKELSEQEVKEQNINLEEFFIQIARRKRRHEKNI